MASTSAALLLLAVLGAACATSVPERRASPPPSPAVLQEFGYREVVQIGQDYARAQGYDILDEGLEAVELRPNYWRIRFALAPRGSGRLLQLEFDESARRIVGFTELGEEPGAAAPIRGPVR